MYKCKNCGKAFECDKPLQDGDALCPACSGECTKAAGEALADDGVVLINGVMSFEVETICKRLDRANIRFSLQPMSANESGIINARPENAAAGLTNIANAFSSSGLSTCYQIRVAAEDYAKAKELVGQSEENQITESEPPPKSAFTDPEPDPVGVVGPKGIWGWNIIPMLNVLAMVLLGAWGIWHEYTPIFFNGTAAALSTPGNEAYNPPLLNLIVFETVGNFAIVAFSLMVLICLFKRDKRYPKLCAVLFWSAALFEGIDIAAAAFQEVKLEESSPRDLLRSLVFAVIWMKYFKSSVRIANTFTGSSSVKKPAVIVLVLWCLTAAGFFGFRWYEAYKANQPGPTKQYVCHLEAVGDENALSRHIGCYGLIDDAYYALIRNDISSCLRKRVEWSGFGVVKQISVDDKTDIVVEFACEEVFRSLIVSSLVTRAWFDFRLEHENNYELVENLMTNGIAPRGMCVSNESYVFNEDVQALASNGNYIAELQKFHVPSDEYCFMLSMCRNSSGGYDPYFVSATPVISGKHIDTVTVDFSDEKYKWWVVWLNEEGMRAWSQIKSTYGTRMRPRNEFDLRILPHESLDSPRGLAAIYEGCVMDVSGIYQTTNSTRYLCVQCHLPEADARRLAYLMSVGTMPVNLKCLSVDEIKAE